MIEYPHNGIVCKECHTTIDLTALGPGSIQRSTWTTRAGYLGKATVHRGDYFDLACPYCGANETYDEKNVRPLFDSRGLEDRIAKLEARFDDPHFHSDIAKAVLKKIAEQEPTAKPDHENPLAR